MIVAFDNTFLSLFLNPKTIPRPNPSTGKPVDHYALRIEALIDDLTNRKDTILLPTPCLAELLCAVPDFEKAIADINKTTAFEVAPFDARCAIELATISRVARESGDKRSGIVAGWNEVKFDRQIAVIAKVGKANVFYTDDQNQASYSKMIGLEVRHTWDLDLPDNFRQQILI